MQQEVLTQPPSRLSRDEMNLAEFPLTILTTRAAQTTKTLEFRDTVRTKNGEVINREWIITGADKFGLPTSSDDEVLLGLLKLTVDQGFQDRKIFFTRYELMRVLQWSTEGRNYKRLQRALDRLSGVRIKATNAFFDNIAKSHSTVNFGIIDAYEINDGRDTAEQSPAPSFFIWSEVLFNSFQVGYIKKLDLGFYLGLQSAVSKRLFRYLDKHFWYRSSLRINVMTLAHEKVGISRNYRFLSSLRQQLDPAFDELKAQGFLSGVQYEGKGSDAEVVIYAAQARPRVMESVPPAFAPPSAGAQNGRGNGRNSVDGAAPSISRQQVEALLTARGIKATQLPRLLDGRPTELLDRIIRIVEYFDFLVARRSKLVSLSPVGFLYRAVENAESFVLPEDNRAGREQQLALVGEGLAAQRVEKKQPADNQEMTDKSDYLLTRKREILAKKAAIEPDMLANMRKEAEKALERLRGHISERNFQETVEVGVEEKIARLFAIPSYEEWVREKGRKVA